MLTTLIRNGWVIEDCDFAESTTNEKMCRKGGIRILLREDHWELYYLVEHGLSFGTVGQYGTRQSQQLRRAIEQYKRHGGLNNEVQF